MDSTSAKAIARQISLSVTFPLNKLVLNDCALNPEGVDAIVTALGDHCNRRVGGPSSPFQVLHDTLRLPSNAHVKLEVLSLERNVRLGMFNSEAAHAAAGSIAALIKSPVPLVALSVQGSASAYLRDHLVQVRSYDVMIHLLAHTQSHTHAHAHTTTHTRTTRCLKP